MMVFTVDHISEAWKTLVENIVMKGEVVSPRGLKTKEIEDVIVEYPHVDGFTFINKKRKINPVFHLVELFYFLNGRNDNLLVQYVTKMEHFQNEVGRFDGSYGPSIYESLPFAINSLQRDSDSRRSVVPILRSHHLNHFSKDIPCNIFLGFRIRHESLNMDVFTRSQDLYRGFLYDTLEFQLLQQMVANVLGVEPGHYINHILSLHLYQEDISPAIESLNEPSSGSNHPSFPDFLNDQDSFWEYARCVSNDSEFGPGADPKFAETQTDIPRAIVSWKDRRQIQTPGLYSDWVNWWLKS